MRSKPGVIEIGRDTSAGIVERDYGRAVVIEIGVGAGKIAALIGCAGETINALVVAGQTGSIRLVVRTAGSVRERSEVIIEGVILLHDDDNVIDVVQIALGEDFGRASKWNEKECCKQCCTSHAHGEPPCDPREGIDWLHRRRPDQE